MKPSLVLIFTFLLLPVICLQAQTQGRSSTEKLLGTVNTSTPYSLLVDNFAISADARHFAFCSTLSDEELQLAKDRINELREDEKRIRKESRELDLPHSLFVYQVTFDGQKQKLYGTFKTPLQLSSDGKHCAYAVGDIQKYWAVLDGVEQEPKFDDVLSPTFSADGKNFAYVGTIETGKYPARKVAVINGQKQKIYDDILFLDLAKKYNSTDVEDGVEPDSFWDCFLCSPVGGRMCYVARKGTNYFVVIDGKEEGPYQDLDKTSLRFSPDGQHFAYGATSNEQSLVVVDGQPQSGKLPLVGNSLKFSPDSQHVAYMRSNSDRQQEVVFRDGKREKPYSLVVLSSLSFSPDSQHLGYVAKVNRDHFCVVVDGVQQKKYRNISQGPIFSPDGSRVAYRAKKDRNETILVVDDKEIPAGNNPSLAGIWFSPDSKQLAYLTWKNGKNQMVVNDGLAPAWENVSFIRFSPDSQHFAYLNRSRDGSKSALEVDGTMRQFNGYPQTLQFTSDSRHFLYVEHLTGRESVIVDGHPGRTYGIILPARHPIIYFDSPTHFHYLAFRDNHIYTVEENLN
jgi:WD40-like Beta Propeller Repeat